MPAERGSRDGINVARIGAGAAVIGAAVAVAVLGAWGLIVGFGGTLHGPLILPATVPTPALEPHPLIDRRAYDFKERQKLSSYGWVDRDKGVVHIPLDAAMTLLSQRAAARETPGKGSSP